MAASDESGAPVRVELWGISAYTRHGVTEAEREVGQRLEIDLVLELADAEATRTDELAGTIDYAEACDVAVTAATEASYQTLERLAQVIGERLVERLGADAATVRASKPEPPLDHITGAATVEVTVRRDDTRVSERTGYLGLGSNVGDREASLQAAIDALDARGVAVEAVSSLYETEPVGEVLDQPDFLNAAIRIRTALEPAELLAACKDVEAELGRQAGGPRHGPRPIDVDVLLLGDIELESDALTLPHAEVTSRRFVLEPLLELDSELELPGGAALADARDALEGQRVARVGRL